MKVFNIRRGLATNSSSSHSMIRADGLKDRWAEGGQFGWEQFIAVSKRAKLRYLAAILVSRADDFWGLQWDSPEDRRQEVYTEIARLCDLEDENVDGFYVDHQSVDTLDDLVTLKPLIVRGQKRGPYLPGFEALKEALLADDVGVMGGNDNG